MLVLTRQIDQSIRIGDEISVTIVDIRGDKIRIGVEAPRSMAVHRSEVADDIRRHGRRRPAIAGYVGPRTRKAA